MNPLRTLSHSLQVLNQKTPYPLRKALRQVNDATNPLSKSPQLFQVPKEIRTVPISTKPTLHISQDMGIQAVQRMGRNATTAVVGGVLSGLCFATGLHDVVSNGQPWRSLLNETSGLGGTIGLLATKAFRKTKSFERQFAEVDEYGFNTLKTVTKPHVVVDEIGHELMFSGEFRTRIPHHQYWIEHQKDSSSAPVFSLKEGKLNMPGVLKNPYATNPAPDVARDIYQQLDEAPVQFNNTTLREAFQKYNIPM
jgi:hypothetical protein